MSLKICIISDTHNNLSRVDLPEADVLVHCGDATNLGEFWEVQKLVTDLNNIAPKYKNIIIVAGNHDGHWYKEKRFVLGLLPPKVTYLEDSEIVIDGFKFYGSPWTPRFGNWWFMRDRGKDIRRNLDLIPNGLDVLITHGPPKGILDMPFGSGEHVGCLDLLEVVSESKPRYHVFGHIHGSYGEFISENTHFINASICNENYSPSNLPKIINL